MAASGIRSTRSTTHTVQIAALGANRFQVKGPLTFATARRASQAGEKAFAATDAREFEVSCEGVDAADSAGLAVLLHWMGWARRHDRVLRLTNLPAAIMGVARISEVEGLLQPQSGGS